MVVNLEVVCGGAEDLGVKGTRYINCTASNYAIVTVNRVDKEFTKLLILKSGDSITASISSLVPVEKYQFTVKTSSYY